MDNDGKLFYINKIGLNGSKLFLTDKDSQAMAVETFVVGKPGQLWKRGQPNNEGYYTLQSSESQKLITANLHLQGKCTLNTRGPEGSTNQGPHFLQGKLNLGY